jgi:hypothetical protein
MPSPKTRFYEETLLPASDCGPRVFDVKQTEIMNLLFSTTILITNKLFIEPNVGIPLTDRSFSIAGIRIPYRF